jgi:hypothetical protein
MTHVTLTRGDAVRLTERFAAALCRSPKARVDWKARRGIVAWTNRSIVAVAWGGRKSIDPLPHAAVRKIQPVTQPCPGCDGHECDDGCQYPGAAVSTSSTT